MPEIGVAPPDLMLITVRIVAPAPGRPDSNPDAVFAMPCPISSLLESWFVWVMLSATSDVNNESIAPSRASTTPAFSSSDRC